MVRESYLTTAIYINKKEKLKVLVSESLSLLVQNILSLCYLRYRKMFFSCLTSLLGSISEFQIYLVYVTQCSPLPACEFIEGQKCLINLFYLFNLLNLENLFLYRGSCTAWLMFFQYFYFKVNAICILPRECLPLCAVAVDTELEREVAPPPFPSP